MRHYIKSLLITIASFYTTANFIPTITAGDNPKNLPLIIAGLWLITLAINPIFSLVFLPINILTFGLISSVLNIAFLFALINFLPGFHIAAFTFPGANINGIILPIISLNQISTIIIIALAITVLQKLLHIVFE